MTKIMASVNLFRAALFKLIFVLWKVALFHWQNIQPKILSSRVQIQDIDELVNI